MSQEQDDFGAGILDETSENCGSLPQRPGDADPQATSDGGPSADSTEARGVEQPGSSLGS